MCFLLIRWFWSCVLRYFFLHRNTAYGLLISAGISDVCSSVLRARARVAGRPDHALGWLDQFRVGGPAPQPFFLRGAPSGVGLVQDTEWRRSGNAQSDLQRRGPPGDSLDRKSTRLNSSH